MSFCNGNFQKRISRVEISRNFNGNFQGENFHFGNFHSLAPLQWLFHIGHGWVVLHEVGIGHTGEPHCSFFLVRKSWRYSSLFNDVAFCSLLLEFVVSRRCLRDGNGCATYDCLSNALAMDERRQKGSICVTCRKGVHRLCTCPFH